MSGKKFIPSEFDRRLGQIIALTRNRFGMSQKDLANHLGVTFQQVQKYETGANRVSAARLDTIAHCFGMTIGQMIDGCAQEYVNDSDVRKMIELMYKMDTCQRRFILQAAGYVANAAV